MKMFDKLKPVIQWVKYECHNPDADYVEIVVRAAKRFELDDKELFALCENLGVQFVRVKSNLL